MLAVFITNSVTSECFLHAETLDMMEPSLPFSWCGRRCWQPTASDCRTVMIRRWPPCVWRASDAQSGLPASLECRWVEVSRAPESLVGCVLSDLAKLRNYQTLPISQKVSANYLLMPAEKKPTDLC